ncbi:hypothetical protein [Streptomyces sp. NPDC051662]|uniref:hypothetical protein n=1 Tax=Streptomyces sp. NPDC051662 TaxID=3154750 RepID=UPI00341F1681
MTEVVMVHGIGPLDESPDEMRADWVGALTGTLRKAGHTAHAQGLESGRTSVSMAYYRHLFKPFEPKNEWDCPLPETLARIGGDAAQDILGNVARHATDPIDRADADRELAALGKDTGPEQGVMEIFRLAVAGLAHVGPLAQSGFATLSSRGMFHLGQVAGYLGDESVRKQAVESVLACVTPRTRVVFAHSLGTVVAYEALHRVNHPLPLLVTFGSPLGMRTIVRERLRPNPLRVPPRLERWVNVVDRDDFIVAKLHLERLFPCDGGVFESSRKVRNPNLNPHAAVHYLGHPETALPLTEVL